MIVIRINLRKDWEYWKIDVLIWITENSFDNPNLLPYQLAPHIFDLVLGDRCQNTDILGKIEDVFDSELIDKLKKITAGI